MTPPKNIQETQETSISWSILNMHNLNALNTAKALPYRNLVAAIEQAALELSRQQINAPERLIVPMGANNVLLCMPAVGQDISVTKLVTVHNKNCQHHLPAIQGEVIVMDTQTGRRISLLDGPTVTARRTAAVTLLGIQTLLPHTPRSALIIGTGVQSSEHVDALVDFFDLRQFWIAGTSLEKTKNFCVAIQQHHPHIIANAISSEQLQLTPPNTDILIALTTSKKPVIPVHISPQTLAIGVGAFKPDMAEFPPELLHSRQIIVDDIKGAKQEAGDLLQANINWITVRDIASVLNTKITASGARPIYKTVGQAAWDLAAARVALDTMNLK